MSLLSFDSTSFPEEPCLLGEDVWGGPEGVRVGDPGGAGQLKPGGDPGGARQLKPFGDPGYPRDPGDPEDLRYPRDSGGSQEILEIQEIQEEIQEVMVD